MKLLVDTCLSGTIADKLKLKSHDVIWAGDWPEDPGDEEILARARNEGRVLVTLDKDFGELVFLHSKPHSGIIRLVNLPIGKQATVCAGILEAYRKELEEGGLITVEAGRIRVRT